jgi:hypothetical protein
MASSHSAQRASAARAARTLSADLGPATKAAAPNAPQRTEAPVPPTLTAEVLAAWPHKLIHARAHLVIGDGRYLFQWREQGIDRYKYLAPEAVAAAFAAEPLDTGWLPPNTLRAGRGAQGEFYLQVIPAGRHLIRVLFAGGKAPQCVAVPLPTLLWAGYGRHYACWAVAEREPIPTSRLHYPPLPNLFHHTGVCWGANTPPAVTASGMQVAWRLFIAESFFNGNAVDGRSRAHPDDVRQQLRVVARLPEATPYPVDDLIPLQRAGGAVTLKDGFEAIVLGAEHDHW